MELTTNAGKHILHALKNGVVPDENLALLRVGLDKEMTEFQRCFNLIQDGNGVVKFLSGGYGSGKSFLLNIVKQKAIENNFIVSKIQIDRGFRLNSVEHLYYHIMHNLFFKSTDSMGTSFEDLFDMWIQKLQEFQDKDDATEEINYVISTLNKYNISFSRAFLAYIRAKIGKNKELSDAILSWITGERNIPAEMKTKFEIIGNIDKINSMDFLKAFIRLITLLGYSGIVILIDELELIMNERIDIRKNSYENIRYIIDLCCSGEMKNSMFVFAGTDALFEDREKGIRNYEALSQRLGDAIDKNNGSLLDMRQPIMIVKNLNVDEVGELTDKIISIYKLVYDFEPKISNESIKNWALLSYRKSGIKISELSIREYLTKLIEILDIMEQNPQNSIFKAELKTVNNGEKEIYVNNSLKSQAPNLI